jgi:hypothetical protein
MADKNHNKFKVGDLVVLSAYGLGLKCQPNWLKTCPQTIGFIVEKSSSMDSMYPYTVMWFTNNEVRRASLNHSRRELKSVRYK